MIAPVIDAALGRSRTILSLLIFLLIAGAYAYQNIPKESSPDINIPIIYVSMALEGISPTDSERLLLRPMEQELSAIEGVKKLKSTGYTGGGFVVLEFQAGLTAIKPLMMHKKQWIALKESCPIRWIKTRKSVRLILAYFLF